MLDNLFFKFTFTVYIFIILQLIQAVVAERLRRLTRNQIPFGSVGSNPTNCVSFSSVISNFFFDYGFLWFVF